MEFHSEGHQVTQILAVQISFQNFPLIQVRSINIILIRCIKIGIPGCGGFSCYWYADSFLIGNVVARFNLDIQPDAMIKFFKIALIDSGWLLDSMTARSIRNFPVAFRAFFSFVSCVFYHLRIVLVNKRLK